MTRTPAARATTLLLVVVAAFATTAAAADAALSPSLRTDAIIAAGRCRQIRLPALNAHHELVHIHSFENVEAQARALCERRGVAEHRCDAVVREMRAASSEMAALDVNEGLVNVTLDFSLSFSVTQQATSAGDTAQGQSALGMVTVLPEEPLERTIASHCSQNNLDAFVCSQIHTQIEKMVVGIWGCENDTELHRHSTEASSESRDEEGEEAQVSEESELAQITLPFVVAGKDAPGEHKLTELVLSATRDLELQVAIFCRKYTLNLHDCGQLLRRAQDATRSLAAFQREEQQRQMDPKALNITSPVSTRLYPFSRRVYVEVSPTSLLNNITIGNDQVCLFVDYVDTPALCSPELFKDPKFFERRGLPVGYHIFMFAKKKGQWGVHAQSLRIEDDEWFAAVHVRVAEPTLEFQGIVLNTSSSSSIADDDTSSLNGGGGDKKLVYLSAKLQTSQFDIADPRHRFCVHHNDDFACMQPHALAIESDARADTEQNRSMVVHVPIFGASSGPHELSFMVLNEYGNVVTSYGPLTVNLALNADAEPLPRNAESTIIDQRRFVPQRPSVCPESLRANRALRWICDLWRHEWGLFSQNGEDGVLKSIFHNIGVAHKEYVEFGTEDGSECNTRYWRELYNWTGLLMDGSHENSRINLHREFVTAENINALFAKHNVSRHFDLLSIDVDFNDFWILDAIDLEKFTPRVIVIEYNSHVPPSESRAVKYNATRSWDHVTDYFGVSMSALEHWGQRHSYALVYCESHGVNCFLVHKDALAGSAEEDMGELPLLEGEQLFAPPNFFGKGWSYPNASRPEDEWEWL